MNGLRKGIYRISWAVIFGQIVFAISVVVADALHSRWEIVADDGWAILAAPLGIWAGWRFANRSLTWHRFHIVSVIVGGLLTPVLVSQAVRYHQAAQALQGTGFLAGLGEEITAGLCFYLGVGSFCLFFSGAATSWSGWRFSLRSLLVGMTVVAVALATIFVLSG
jgi:hypothetical protein